MPIFKDEHDHGHLHIFGGVYPDGTAWFGEGFKSRLIMPGTYEIIFTPSSFAELPAVVCTIHGNPVKTFNLSVATSHIEPGKFYCTTSSPNYPVDCAFTFIAFGDPQ